MGVLSLIMAIIALIVVILVYQKAGGTVEVRKRIDWIGSLVDLGKSVDPLTSAVDSSRSGPSKGHIDFLSILKALEEIE